MISEWNVLSEEAQVAFAREALRRAVTIIADQAEQLAAEMEYGRLSDRGGPEALRLLCALVRVSTDDTPEIAGHA